MSKEEEKIREEDLKKLTLLLDQGLPSVVAARAIGVHPSTINGWSPRRNGRIISKPNVKNAGGLHAYVKDIIITNNPGRPARAYTRKVRLAASKKESKNHATVEVHSDNYMIQLEGDNIEVNVKPS